MSKNYIIYNGKHSYEDFGLLIDHIILPSINEVIEEIEIEGRNGTLTERKGYYNDRNLEDDRFERLKKLREIL